MIAAEDRAAIVAGGQDVAIDAGLFRACRPHFHGTVLREIIQAASGHKVSRVIQPPTRAATLRRLGAEFGFAVVEGRRTYAPSPDQGKGRFSNRLQSGASDGQRFTYVASSAAEAVAARDCEEGGDSDGFGALLGIPSCCRDAYQVFLPRARHSQGDLLPLVCDNTAMPARFDPWLNVAVRYFGTCLISFFPCSFHCGAAILTAKRTFASLSACDEAWAQSFLAAHRTNVLYTEQHGVHAFRNEAIGHEIRYDGSSLASTEDTAATRLLRQGNRLKIAGRQRVIVQRDSTRLGSIDGHGVRVCVFSADPAAICPA